MGRTLRALSLSEGVCNASPSFFWALLKSLKRLRKCATCQLRLLISPCIKVTMEGESQCVNERNLSSTAWLLHTSRCLAQLGIIFTRSKRATQPPCHVLVYLDIGGWQTTAMALLRAHHCAKPSQNRQRIKAKVTPAQIRWHAICANPAMQSQSVSQANAERKNWTTAAQQGCETNCTPHKNASENEKPRPNMKESYSLAGGAPRAVMHSWQHVPPAFAGEKWCNT